MCEECGDRPVEFHLKNVDHDDRPQREICRPCLTDVLADDTASMIRISRE